MEKFLIEIINGGDTASCLRSIQSFLASRTHYVTSAEWGCIEGEKKAWLIIKTSNSDDAMRIIPAAYRETARITRLHKFSGKEIDESLLSSPEARREKKGQHLHQEDLDVKAIV
jgi:replicative superfamily II helicase